MKDRPYVATSKGLCMTSASLLLLFFQTKPNNVAINLAINYSVLKPGYQNLNQKLSDFKYKLHYIK